MKRTAATPKARQNEIVVQEMNDEVLIYDLQTHKAYCLNKTSALIWQFCDGTKTVADISRALTGKLKHFVPEDLIWLALDGLKKDNLLDQSQEIAIDFQGLSRREVIRKVGLASLVALPAIASLVAPTAANAQSAAAPAGLCEPCTPAGSTGNCTVGTCKNTFPDPGSVCAINSNNATARSGQQLGCGYANDGSCTNDGVTFCCSGAATFNPATTCCTCN